MTINEILEQFGYRSTSDLMMDLIKDLESMCDLTLELKIKTTCGYYHARLYTDPNEGYWIITNSDDSSYYGCEHYSTFKRAFDTLTTTIELGKTGGDSN